VESRVSFVLEQHSTASSNFKHKGAMISLSQWPWDIPRLWARQEVRTNVWEASVRVVRSGCIWKLRQLSAAGVSCHHRRTVSTATLLAPSETLTKPSPPRHVSIPLCSHSSSYTAFSPQSLVPHLSAIISNTFINIVLVWPPTGAPQFEIHSVDSIFIAHIPLPHFLDL
jgi:hypothetical protein